MTRVYTGHALFVFTGTNSIKEKYGINTVLAQRQGLISETLGNFMKVYVTQSSSLM